MFMAHSNTLRIKLEMKPGELWFVTCRTNVSHDPWWWVDNRMLSDDNMIWLPEGTPFILVSDIRIGGTEMWQIFTPEGTCYTLQSHVRRYAARQ